MEKCRAHFCSDRFLKAGLIALFALLLCGTAVGAAGAAEPTNLTDSINLIEYGEVTLTDDSTDIANYILGTNSPFKDKATYSAESGTPTLTLKTGEVVDLEHELYILVDADEATGEPAFTIDLNGGVIQRKPGLVDDNKFRLITILSGKGLTLQDSAPATPHTFTFVKDGPWTIDQTPAADAVPLAAFDRAAAEKAGVGTYHVSVPGGCIAGARQYGSGGGVCVEGGFTMTGGNIVGNTAPSIGGGVYVKPNGKFTLSGGNIVGNSAINGGGGVCVEGGFTMTGGNIVGNTAEKLYGGGVYVFGIGGTFTLSGGNIVGNSAPGSSGYGGGVEVFLWGSFTMSGGNIIGNSAIFGGGVSVGGSETFTMTGGKISGNYASSSGGGVNITNGGSAFNVSGNPNVSGNTAGSSAAANNVYLGTSGSEDQAFVKVTGALSGANIGIAVPPTGKFGEAGGEPVHTITSTDAACFFPDSGLAVANTNGSDLTWDTNPDLIGYGAASFTASTICATEAGNPFFDSANKKWLASYENGVLTLEKTVTLEHTLTILAPKSGTPFTIDLNGQVLQRSTAEGTSAFSVITVDSGAELVVKDSNTPENTHYFQTVENEQLLPTWKLTNLSEKPEQCIDLDQIKSYDGEGGDGWAGTDPDGKYVYHYVAVPGGVITGGQTSEEGGGVYVKSNGKFTLSGGNIIGNSAPGNGKSGGGVYNEGTFTMVDGSISGNKADNCGGGVCLISADSKFTMSGGNIVGNSAIWGGGVCLSQPGNKIFTMSGGNIVGNSATWGGGGVNVDADSTFSVSGTPVIKGNKITKDEGEANNVKVGDDHTLKLTGPLTAGAEIITKVGEVSPTEGGKFGTTTLPALPGIGGAEHFIADGATPLVGSIGDGNISNVLKWVMACTVTFNKNGHGTAPEDQIVPKDGKVTKPADPTETGWNFEGWYTEAACETAWNFDTYTVSENTTLYAKWTQEVPPKPSHGGSSGSSYWITSTPTAQPTVKPTAEPTVNPTQGIPTVQPIEQPTAKSPAPIMGILAGLGAAAAAFGLRRK